jgi:hypothetical protein
VELLQLLKSDFLDLVEAFPGKKKKWSRRAETKKNASPISFFFRWPRRCQLYWYKGTKTDADLAEAIHQTCARVKAMV